MHEFGIQASDVWMVIIMSMSIALTTSTPKNNDTIRYEMALNRYWRSSLSALLLLSQDQPTSKDGSNKRLPETGFNELGTLFIWTQNLAL